MNKTIAVPMSEPPPKKGFRISASEHNTRRAESRHEGELGQVDAAKQDPAAFAPLYEAHASMVWRYTLSRLGDQELAADATSTTFTRALAGLPAFQAQPALPNTGFTAWLMQIATHVVIDHVRRRKPFDSLDAWRGTLALPSTDPSPEEQAILADDVRVVLDALDQLVPAQRQIVELRSAGFSVREVAGVVGSNERAVRSAYHRAITKLRDLLAASAHDWSTTA